MNRRITHIFCLVISVLFTVYAFQFDVGTASKPGPGMWPAAGALLMLVCSLVLLFKEREDVDYEASSMKGLMSLLVAMAILALGAAIFAVAGMVISIFFVVFCWLMVLGGEPLWLSAAVSAGVVIVVYLVFDMALGIPFPQDVILNLLGL